MASATYLHDQYLPLTPILLVISSSCPVYKGKLSDFDNRFNLIMQGVDDRTDEEVLSVLKEIKFFGIIIIV